MSAVRSGTSRASLAGEATRTSTPGGELISAASSTRACASSWRRNAICCARSSSARRSVAVCTGGSSLLDSHEAGLLDRLVDLAEQAVGLGQQALRRLGAPPGDAHVVHQRLHRLAPALLGDQLLVGELRAR